MTLYQIQDAIAKGEFNNAELSQLVSFIQGVKTRQTKSSISVGDAVWVVQKTKRTPGVVESIKIKKAIVSMRGKRYNVPLSMLAAQ
jgi:putative ribosome biogenesis GTPase RsgA